MDCLGDGTAGIGRIRASLVLCGPRSSLTDSGSGWSAPLKSTSKHPLVVPQFRHFQLARISTIASPQDGHGVICIDGLISP